ncbi:MAG: hypothetical protein IMZ61_11540 [Planctomycetes bacterium]|nr:hypothetical protein [Planctomycetota bacterium]
MSLKKKLEELTKQAKNSGEGEFNNLMEFLNDQYESCHGVPQDNIELLKAICDQFIETATYIKKELSNV